MNRNQVTACQILAVADAIFRRPDSRSFEPLTPDGVAYHGRSWQMARATERAEQRH